ncbi:MAG TPA: DUF1553 domain-containing protein, partial [Planctomycetota bacterium]|nr:DUF1553 domain-containing protein [Planctomycetota bacterium]
DLPALGFLGLGPKYDNRGDPEVMNDEWEDRIDVVTRGLLGLTVACARCHDHKYDPITTADYYALAGVFASTRMANFPLDESRKTKKNGDTEKPEDAMHIVREGKPRDLKVLIRGDVRREGDLAPRRFLSAFSPTDPPILFTQGSGRLELARAIVDPKGPLAARVIVNRIWAAWFDRGIVATPSNFGVLGEKPSHPELLDDLAVRFVENGWSLRWLHREIALSATYRQSSIASEAALLVDPANVLLSRAPRKRLEVEAWRDATLFASGALDLRMGGPSFDLSKSEERRRTLYGEVSRFELERLLVLFDFPDANVHASRRVHTTTPLQKLFSLNGPLLERAAKGLAERLRADVPEEPSSSDVARVSVERSGEPGGRDGASVDNGNVADSESMIVRRVRRAWEVVYARQPDAEELAMAIDFLSDVERAGGDPWTRLAHALLASNEAYFVD